MSACTQNPALTRRSAVSLAASAALASLGFFLRTAPALAELAAPAEPVAQTVADLVYAVEEPAGTRVVTPFYSVLVPSELGDGEIVFTYRDLFLGAGEAAGRYFSHVLTASCADDSFTVACYDPAVYGSTVQAGWGTAPVEGLLSSDGLAIQVGCTPKMHPQGGMAETWDDATARALLCASFVEPAPASPHWALPPAFVVTEAADGSARAETPWYALDLPVGALPVEGVLSYFESLPAVYAAGDPEFATHALCAVFDALDETCGHVSLRCVGTDAETRYAGAYAIADSGVVTADGLRVCAFVPLEGDPALNGEPQAIAELWASWVTPMPAAPATRVETGCYSFDVPDYWEGRVEIRVSGEAAYVSPLGRPGPDLVWITVRDAADPMPSGGDIMQWLGLTSLPVPGGRVAWMSGANFGYAVGSGAWEGGVEDWPAYDEALAGELVDLATGGVLTLEDARADWRTASNAVYAYYVDEVVPRLVAAGC